jgi:hypothetical protein
MKSVFVTWVCGTDRQEPSSDVELGSWKIIVNNQLLIDIPMKKMWQMEGKFFLWGQCSLLLIVANIPNM